MVDQNQQQPQVVKYIALIYSVAWLIVDGQMMIFPSVQQLVTGSDRPLDEF